MTQANEPIQPAPEAPAPTQEQLDAVNARLDAHDAATRRARNRRIADNATPHVDPPPNFVSRTLDASQIAAGIEVADRADPEVAKLIEGSRAHATAAGESVAWLTEQARSLGEMTSSLLVPGQTSQRLLASAFVAEVDKFASKVGARVVKVLATLDSEIVSLEKAEQRHAEAARDAIRTPMSPAVAGEIRQWLRGMPDDQARNAAVRESVAAGDREVLTALIETGVPPRILGFRDRKMFDLQVASAEQKFGPEHVARRKAAAALRAKLKATRDHLHASSEATCAIAQLAKQPALAAVVAKVRAQ